MPEFSDHANYNGGTLLLIASCLTLAGVTLGWLRSEMSLSKIPLKHVLCVNRTRLLAAWALAGVAIAAGSIVWFPAFPMLIAVERHEAACAGLAEGEPGYLDCHLMLAQARAWADWFTRLAPWPANIANLLVSVAATMSMWFVISSWLGRWAVPVVVLAAGLIYYLGAMGSELWAWLY